MKKIQYISLLALAILVIMPLVSASLSSEGSMFGIWANRTGFSNQTGVANLSSYIVNNQSGFASLEPVISNNIFYLVNNSGTVIALNALNVSQRLATFETNDAPLVGNLIVAGDTLYVPTDVHIFALNATNISIQIGNITQGTNRAKMVVYNDVLYTGNNTKVQALNASNISQRLTNFKTGNVLSSGITIYNNKVYIGNGSSTFFALNASNLSQQLDSHKYASFSGSFGIPIVANDIVYVATNSNNVLHAINASNVSQEYNQFTPGTGQLTTPSFANDIIHVATFAGGGILYELNASDISQQLADPAVAGSFRSQGIISSDNIFYETTANSFVYAYNASNTSVYTSYFFAGFGANGFFTAPILHNGRIYAMLGNGGVFEIFPTPPIPPAPIDHSGITQIRDGIVGMFVNFFSLAPQLGSILAIILLISILAIVLIYAYKLKKVETFKG